MYTLREGCGGNVNTVGGTTFTDNVTFEGNTTFGDAVADTVTFAALTTIINDIAFNGAGYRVRNMLDPLLAQDAATKNYVDTNTVASFSGGTTGLTPSSPTTGAVVLGGTLDVDNGGTGSPTLALNNVLLGNGTSALQTVAPGASSNVLTSNGTTWQSTAIPAATNYSFVTITTAQAANTAVTVAGAAAQANSGPSARVAGIVTATNTVQILGICTCDVEGILTIVAGDVVFLSATEAGAVTNVAPSTSTQVVAELGIATAGSGGGTVAVLWQPKSIVVL
jgi:hypothetical protein